MQTMKLFHDLLPWENLLKTRLIVLVEPRDDKRVLLLYA